MKSLLDFIYLVQYLTYDKLTLGYLEATLDEFYQNKKYFIQVGYWNHLNFPKLHSLLHYSKFIQFFGIIDNYNTEMFKKLHMDFAKNGWRATNQRDKFPQMIIWLSQQEKITSFHIILMNMQEPKTPKIIKSIAKHPHYRNCSIPVIENLQQAPEFGCHLKQFLNTFIISSTSSRTLDQTNLPLLFSLNIFKLFRFNLESLQNGEDVDLVWAIPV